MGLASNAKDVGLDAIAAVLAYAGLHEDTVGSGDTNEISGGSPAYARQALTWASASGGTVAITGTETFDIPSGATVARLGLHSAVTSGTYYGDAELTDEAYAGQGTYQLDSLSVSITG